MAALIAYFSRADENYFCGQLKTIPVGNTELAARTIHGLTGAPLFKIEMKHPYAADYNTCISQAQKDQKADARPELKAGPETLDGYDEIYLGYPNYWGTMPMAVFTFLEHYDFTGKSIHPFCTHEGSGLSGTERKIAAACAGATVTVGLAVPGSRAEACGSLVLRWLNK